MPWVTFEYIFTELEKELQELGCFKCFNASNFLRFVTALFHAFASTQLQSAFCSSGMVNKSYELLPRLDGSQRACLRWNEWLNLSENVEDLCDWKQLNQLDPTWYLRKREREAFTSTGQPLKKPEPQLYASFPFACFALNVSRVTQLDSSFCGPFELLTMIPNYCYRFNLLQHQLASELANNDWAKWSIAKCEGFHFPVCRFILRDSRIEILSREHWEELAELSERGIWDFGSETTSNR